MNKPFLQFVVLAWPFIMGWVLLALHFWARQISELRPVLTIKTFLADWALPIPTVSAVRIVITLLSGLFFAYPAFRNYSSIFPQNLRVAAFFDNEGIKKAIEQFDEKDLADFRLASNWSAEKEDYFEMIKSKLRESDIAAPSEFTFQDPTWHVFSKGSTTFVVNKAEGFQKYRIVSA